jgi:hypothetical protein
MEELLLLKILLNKEEYLKYHKYLDTINLENEPKAILTCIGSYYEEYPDAQDISLDEIKTYFYMKYPLLHTKETYNILFKNLETLEINNKDLLSKTISNLIERYFASDIIESLTQVLSGSRYGLLPGIEDKLKEFYSVSEQKEEASPFVESSLQDLLHDEVTSDGLKWRLNCINQDIGDLRGGSLGHIFARPDTGKTTELAEEATCFAEQLKDDEIVAWFNNEEKGTKVKLRIYCSMLNKTKEEIVADMASAEEEFKARGGDRIKIYDSALITISDIEAILKQYNVRVMIVDQGDKVKFRGDNDMAQHERLKRLYGIFRELAKEYNCDIITAGQASASGEGQQWLGLDMMDNSKTGKPGELDYAIGIGFNTDEGKESLRFFSFAKNKMKNGVHGKHIVRFDALRARYKDIGGSDYASGFNKEVGSGNTFQPNQEVAQNNTAQSTRVY